MSQPAAQTVTMHNVDDYEGFLSTIRQQFAAVVVSGRPLFTTDATGLFDAFLAALPAGETRQHYTCHACRRFVDGFGGLVSISPDGIATPVFWASGIGPDLYQKSVSKMETLVQKASVNGVVVSADAKWGTPQTPDPKKGVTWHHMAVIPPKTLLYKPTSLKSTEARAAEIREEAKMLRRSLHEFSRETVQKAREVLESDALYRGDKYLGIVRWFLDLQDKLEALPQAGDQRANLAWLAAAEAPAGFCHIRSSMVGTLLEDLIQGLPFDAVKRRFDEKMDPMRYRRAVSTPSGGQIAAAERAVQELGIAPAFARRYATASDLAAPGAVIWTPSEFEPPAPKRPAEPKSVGVFDHLKSVPAPGSKSAQVETPARKMTWEKFAREVLPGAALIDYRVPLVGRFCAMTAAVDPAAPAILQWDLPEARNTVSWSFPSPPARADEWGLTPGALARVRCILNSPNLWNAGAERFRGHGRGLFLLLDGARDVRGLPGGGFFIEHLRTDLSPYRATIEAHANRLVVSGADDPASIGFGIGLMEGSDWTEAAAPNAVTGKPAAAAPQRIHVILVIDDSGSMASYIGAARLALASLLSAVRSMPGTVDMTTIMFGSRATILSDRSPLEKVDGLEVRLTGSSGQTALNDTLADAIQRAFGWGDSARTDTSLFLGIVTDGDENHSRRSVHDVAQLVRQAQATGRWTIAYAGAGSHPQGYARSIGIPDGNVMAFEASHRGFEDAGQRYSAATRGLAGSYSSGAKASTSFFAAASARQAIGSDLPVFLVTTKSGSQAAYALDRWD